MKLSACLWIGFLTTAFAGAGDSKNLQPALAKAESLWTQRGQPAQARQCMAAYMEAAVALPTKSEVWYRLARIRSLVATYIEKDPDSRGQLLLQGMDAAWRGLDETYFYGASHRFFGALPTKVPGGNLHDSRTHFEAAIRIAPNYFPTRTLFAELYAVKAKDKALFITQLRYVLDHPADSLIDVTAENRYEQENAHNLLAKVGTLFP